MKVFVIRRLQKIGHKWSNEQIYAALNKLDKDNIYKFVVKRYKIIDLQETICLLVFDEGIGLVVFAFDTHEECCQKSAFKNTAGPICCHSP